MSEVHRYSVVTMLSAAGNKINYAPHGPDVVMASDYDDALAREAALTAVKIGIDDREAGISQEAYQIFLERDGVRLRQIEDERANFKTLNREAVALREELATLRESYESMRDRKNSIVDLQQRLTIAEQRNAELVELLREVLPSLNLAANAFKSVKLIRNKVRAALKPTESGAIHE